MPAVSKAQQRFMGMVHACQKSGKCASKEVSKVAGSIKSKDAEDFARTKHKGLPDKKMFDEGFATWLEHTHPEYELDENWRNVAAGGLAALGGLMGGMQGQSYAAEKPAMMQQASKEIALAKGDPRNPTASISGANLVVKFIGAKLDNPSTTKIKADQYLQVAEQKLGVKATELTGRTKEGNVWVYTYSIK